MVVTESRPVYFESQSWSLDQWNVKTNATLLWKKSHFYFLMLSASLHTLGTIIIIPPIFKILNRTIPVWPIYIILFIASSLLFLGASSMEFHLEVKDGRSRKMKALLLVCLASSVIYVLGALRMGEIVDSSLSMNALCAIACGTLAAGRFIRILIMTNKRWINGLILSPNTELKYQARLVLVGLFEAGASVLFIAYSFQYYYFESASSLLVIASLLRMLAAISFYCEYLAIGKEDISEEVKGEQVNFIKE